MEVITMQLTEQETNVIKDLQTQEKADVYKRQVYGKMKFFLFQKKEYFVLNMATNPLQRLLILKQITSTI